VSTEAAPARSYAVSLRDARGWWFTVGTVATALLSFPTQFLFERGLGVAGFADWLLINALVTSFVPIAAMGAFNLVLSEFFEGHLRDQAGRRALARYFAATTGVGVAGFIAVYAWAPLAGHHSWIHVVLGALIVLARTPVVIAYPLFQIQHRAMLVAFWPAIENLGRFAISLVAVLFAFTFTDAVAWWLALMVALSLFAVLLPGIRTLPPPELGERTASPETVVGRGLRFGIAEYLDSADLKFAIPVAALLLTPQEIAAAGLALLLLHASHFLPFAIATRYLLPAIHSRAARDREAVQRTITRWTAAGTALAAGAGLLTAVFGADVIAFFAEGDYSAQRHVFSYAGLAMVPLCLSTLWSARFLRIEHTRRLVSWRVQATLVFLVLTLATAGPLRAAAPLLGILGCRAYLSLRFARASRAELEERDPRSRMDGP